MQTLVLTHEWIHHNNRHSLFIGVRDLEAGVVLVGELVDVVHLQHEELAARPVHLEADARGHHHRVSVLRPRVHDLLQKKLHLYFEIIW